MPRLASDLAWALLVTGSVAAPSGSWLVSPPSHRSRARSSGCGLAPAIGDGESKGYTTPAGRAYKVHLPRDYNENTPAPLILSYHGAGGDVDQQAGLDRLATTEVNPDHIVVYLQGNADEPERPTRTTWQGAPYNHSDDVGFTRDVLDAVAAAFCVDEARVYATGFSQGGGFVGSQLACAAASDAGGGGGSLAARIAAYAPVSGAYYQKQVDQEALCAPDTVEIACPAISALSSSAEGEKEEEEEESGGRKRAGARTRAEAEVEAAARRVPILALHGGADDTIRYGGGFRSGACLPSIRHFVDTWVGANGLKRTPTNETIEGSGTGVVMRYGSDGLVTLVYAGDNVGHAWMSRATGTASFEASEWIMEFFRRHSLA